MSKKEGKNKVQYNNKEAWQVNLHDVLNQFQEIGREMISVKFLALRMFYEGRSESKERLRIQPAQLLHCSR